MLLATLGRLVPPLSPLTHSLTHEVLISLRSNDYFVGTPIDDEAIGYWLLVIGYRTASPIGRLFEAMGRGKAAMGERRRV